MGWNAAGLGCKGESNVRRAYVATGALGFGMYGTKGQGLGLGLGMPHNHAAVGLGLAGLGWVE